MNPKDINRIFDYIKNKDNFDATNEGNALTQMQKLISHINIKLEYFKDFKKLEDEIVHFKHIHAILSSNELEDLKKKIRDVELASNADEKKKELAEKFKNNEISEDDFIKQLDEINKKPEEEFSKDNIRVKIKNIINHYYVPVIISENEKISYLTHIIKVESEVKFLEKLEEYVKSNEIECDYWFFSKIDEDLDKVYIPYYNKEENRESRFYPDFIFWIKKGNDYYIVFVDPKGIKHTEYEYKVDGYSILFEEQGSAKSFNYNGLNVKVFLFLYTKDINKLSEGYKRYWFDNNSIDKIFKVK